MSDSNKNKGKRLSRHGSSESIATKCGSWGLENDVKSNPILEAMGLSFLPEVIDDDDISSDSSSSILSASPFSEMSVNDRVLQPLSANIQNSVVQFHNEQVTEDFFMFKRRRLNSVRGEDKINNLLHDEHLLHIFKFLPKYMLARCAQVSKRWKRICFDETLWRRLDLGGKNLKPGVVGRVLIRGTKILRLANAEISSPAFTPQLHHLGLNIDIQCKLTHIDFSMAAVETSVLEEIFSVCRQLLKISLEFCTISNLVCAHISRNPHLDTLNLAKCYNIESDGLITIIKRCSNLQNLNMAWTCLGGRDLRLVCLSLPSNLIRLNISGCRDSMVDEHVLLIAKSCPILVELDVSDSIKLTGDSISVIITGLPHIQTLAFSRCYGILPKLFLELKKLPKLSHLDIFGIFSETDLLTVKAALSTMDMNKHMFSSVARPTVGIRRSSIWCQRVRDRFS